MAFSESLATRIRDAVARKKGVKEMKTFGNVLVGVWKDSLIVRLGTDEGDEALLQPHVREYLAVP